LRRSFASCSHIGRYTLIRIAFRISKFISTRFWPCVLVLTTFDNLVNLVKSGPSEWRNSYPGKVLVECVCYYLIIFNMSMFGAVRLNFKWYLVLIFWRY
jgi:hypothetical protein